MGKYSICVNGVWEDFHWKKHINDSYMFSLGNIFIGYIFRIRKNSWTCVSAKGGNRNVFPAEGFNSRMSAAFFLLKVDGYTEKV